MLFDIDLRNDLKTLITHILKDLDYNTLNNTQKLRLLDIALKHSLPKLSIEQHIDSSPSEMTIKFVDINDDIIRQDHHIYD
jgi:hypothetical protein